MIMTRVSFTSRDSTLRAGAGARAGTRFLRYTRARVSSPSLLRRAVGRAIFAAGVAFVAIMVARSCESGGAQATIVIDPRPLGDTVRAVRVDVFDHGTPRGSAERLFGAGQAPERFQVLVAPAAEAELVIEVDAEGGVQRLRRSVEAPAGSTVTVLLGDPTR
jgi:hypothetical protein